MNTQHPLIAIESRIAAARGLADIAMFVHETAAPQDWARLQDSFGHLLGLLDAELARGASTVEEFRAARRGGTHLMAVQ